MKTAISIPDALFREAERYAKQHALSRSELYAQAMAAYLRRQVESKVTASFDAAYDDDDETDLWGNLAEFRAAARNGKRRR